MKYKSVEINATFKQSGTGKCVLASVGMKAVVDCKKRSLCVLGDISNDVIIHSFGRPTVHGNTGYNITCHIYNVKGHYLQSQLINPLGEVQLSTHGLAMGELPRLLKTKRNSLEPAFADLDESRSCCSMM